jgi:hypothetical protein
MSFRRYLSGATADATCVTRVVFLPAQRRTRFHRIIRTTELSVSVNQTERNGDSQRSKANASTYKSACSEWLCRLEHLDGKLAGKHLCSIGYLFSLKQKGLRPIPPTVAKHYCITTRIRIEIASHSIRQNLNPDLPSTSARSHRSALRLAISIATS